MSRRSQRSARPFNYVGPRGEAGPAGPAGADASGDVTHTAGALTANAVALGNGGADLKVLGSLGTTVQVLHGNAAGAPSFGTVVEGDITLADVATLDVSTAKHGLVPKAPNDAAKFLNGLGAWAAVQTTYTVPAAKTDTGNQNDYAAGISGHTMTRWAGAADATFTGVAGGSAGLVWVFKNTSTGKVAYFPHQSGSSSAANRFRNTVTSGATPVAQGGYAVYQHDGTDWQLVAHQQGLAITPTFAAGDFTASGSMTWTVDAGDIVSYTMHLQGSVLHVIFDIITTTVGGTLSNNLRVKLPGGFTNQIYALSVSLNYSDNGSGNTAGFVQVGAGNTYIECYKFNVANWSAATNATGVYGEIFLQVS